MSAALLDIDHVSKRFIKRPSIGERIAGVLGAGRATEIVRAVTDVSLTVRKGEVVGLVGESGCGKSTLGRMIAGIYTPSDGKVLFDAKPVAREKGRRTDKLTTRIQMVHQDPFSSLNPRMRIGDTVGEGPVTHRIVKARDADGYVAETLERVGLDPNYRRRFPHQFSGGQRQRIAIARALAMKPDLLVLDEPVASLDVSIQAQVLNLFMDLRRDLDLTAIFISHDLGVVRHVSDRVAIMYLGRIVELAPTPELYATPNHPYTRALFESVPRVGVGRKDFRPISGEIPSPLHPPSGCHFHPRCPFAGPRCRQEIPALLPVGEGRLSACHLNTGGTA
jgi:oligopeptide/dipeptide ABC transporter ATP-binding protein